VATIAEPGLERRLAAAIEGEVLFDRFSRGRYATDASIYQMMPTGVVVPRSAADLAAALEIARAERVPVLARGGGTSQSGQTVNRALVIDCSKWLNRIVELDASGRRAVVEPGIVLDELNRALRPHGLWFPVDVSTASRATIGGMAGNNSCGARSIRYGMMRDNVAAIDAILADGTALRFDEVAVPGHAGANEPSITTDMLALGRREADEIAARFPKVLRRVGGYNIDALVARDGHVNLAHLLVGSEGTLALSTQIELKLSALPRNRVLGVCHFGSFRAAMDAARHLVALEPIGIELIDDTMIRLARDIALFRPTIEEFVRGDPRALLLVEFAADTPGESAERLARLSELMGDLGFDWRHDGARWGGMTEVRDTGLQARIANVRTSGLNIMMSMKEEGKPVSFVEDCAVELADLGEYTDRLTAIFAKYGTSGTWYAHASVGCLHVRPILNMKTEAGVRTMRAIAEETFEMVRAYKGSHSGEHGDGIVRSEFNEAMFGQRITRAFEEVKDRFDAGGVLNPGKIVRAPRMDDRSLMRYPPGYAAGDIRTVLDWSDWPGAGGGFQGAVEMCNNNGACRKLDGGVMCPSFRVTRNEADVTRGRANTLRLAITGQLGPGAFTSQEMLASLRLCVSCKACRRECPTGVDMARLKIEVLAARASERGIGLHDRLVAYLPRYAPLAARWAGLANLRDRLPGAAALSEKLAGFSARRPLPRWRRDVFDRNASAGPPGGSEVLLFADTFNSHFEPENLSAAMTVLAAAGYRVSVAGARRGARGLCCGRTFLAAGLAEEARREAGRVLDALAPALARGVPIVGLEPSCLYTFRDEYPALIGRERTRAIAGNSFLLEEFLAREADDGRLALPLRPIGPRALVHGHCHQKSFAAMDAVTRTLNLVPELEVEHVETSCCGMAGAFGYGADTYDVSMAMAELSLMPRVRQADAGTLIVADGTSCRQQIADGSGRQALHVARVLERALAGAASGPV
jgi:FAD/FMN-containing dehydrogenase/Fe-S oxidoreductase